MGSITSKNKGGGSDPLQKISIFNPPFFWMASLTIHCIYCAQLSCLHPQDRGSPYSLIYSYMGRRGLIGCRYYETSSKYYRILAINIDYCLKSNKCQNFANTTLSMNLNSDPVDSQAHTGNDLLLHQYSRS